MWLLQYFSLDHTISYDIKIKTKNIVLAPGVASHSTTNHFRYA